MVSHIFPFMYFWRENSNKDSIIIKVVIWPISDFWDPLGLILGLKIEDCQRLPELLVFNQPFQNPPN